MDSDRASIKEVGAAFPRVAAAGYFFHQCQAVYRRVQSLGLAGKYGPVDEFKLRVDKLSALAVLPLEYAAERSEPADGDFLGEGKG